MALALGKGFCAALSSGGRQKDKQVCIVEKIEPNSFFKSGTHFHNN